MKHNNFSLFSFPGNSWIKTIRWGNVFFVLACTCVFLLHGPESILRLVGLGEIKSALRPWIGVLFIIFAFASICCIVSYVLSGLRRFIQSREWRGENAKKKILSLSILAQEQIREHVERKELLKFSTDGDIYAELLSGNFIEVIPPTQGIMANCKLKGWVVKCLNRYPGLVKELHEMDEATREALHF